MIPEEGKTVYESKSIIFEKQAVTINDICWELVQRWPCPRKGKSRTCRLLMRKKPA